MTHREDREPQRAASDLGHDTISSDATRADQRRHEWFFTPRIVLRVVAMVMRSRRAEYDPRLGDF
jgi:hypothetical protein